VRLHISLPAQSLELREDGGHLLRRYAVSTAARGAGEQAGSYRTPRGRHIVRAKIGSGLPADTVFVGRRPTGEIWSPQLQTEHPDRDWILTRILWLSGCEPGFNRLGAVDTMRRYIYLHGSPDCVAMGEPGSHGCVRMRNADIVELFDRVPLGTSVNIVEYALRCGSWHELEPLAAAIRRQVFIEEQGVPAEFEWDDFDAISYHALATGPGGEPIATGRLLPDGHLGRFAVLPAWRGKGVGRAVMERLLDEADARGLRQLTLHAQTYAEGFYVGFGFVAEGDVFMEAGLPHRQMVRLRC
jgi:predicted GNAT family N-acyltransferase